MLPLRNRIEVACRACERGRGQHVFLVALKNQTIPLIFLGTAAVGKIFKVEHCRPFEVFCSFCEEFGEVSFTKLNGLSLA